MKLSKEEIKRKIDELSIDDSAKIELLEIIEDSVDVESDGVSKEEYEKVVAERDEIRQKYKDRFLSSDTKEEIEEKEEKGLEEENDIIDIKEI